MACASLDFPSITDRSSLLPEQSITLVTFVHLLNMDPFKLLFKTTGMAEAKT